MRLLWIALPTTSTVLLMAVTNQMCSDVGVVPLLWVLPLGLYLLSFILCFESDRIYWRPVFWLLLAGAAGVIVKLLIENVYAPILWQIVGYNAALFVCCMVCHGELARLKPHPRRLTAYYLAISAGGAAGGVLVAVAAPLVFPAYFELHIGLWACVALAIVAFGREEWTAARWRRRWFFPMLATGSVAALTILGWTLEDEAREELESSVSASRNFYGALQVQEYNADDPEYHHYALQHGRILHGTQFVASWRRKLPFTYYSEKSGAGLAILNRRPGMPIRLGVVGLGVGTLAAYAAPGDVVRFYEINPEVLRIAHENFSYLDDCMGKCEVALGDARLSLEREPSQQFDVLVLDAFTGDAIPVHLLTAEAMKTYRRHLKPDGVLAVHTSNRFVTLEPVVKGLAAHYGMATAVISHGEDTVEFSPSVWVLVTADGEFLETPEIRGAMRAPEDEPTIAPRLWTDDYSDLLSILQ